MNDFVIELSQSVSESVEQIEERKHTQVYDDDNE